MVGLLDSLCRSQTQMFLRLMLNKDSTLCYKDGPQLPLLNITTTCEMYGRYVIFYNERLDGVYYPGNYELGNVHSELCEVVVQGISLLLNLWFRASFLSLNKMIWSIYKTETSYTLLLLSKSWIDFCLYNNTQFMTTKHFWKSK